MMIATKTLNTATVKVGVRLVAGDEAIASLKRKMGKKWNRCLRHLLTTNARAAMERAEFVRRHAKLIKAAESWENVCMFHTEHF